MKYINVEFNEKNINSFRAFCSENEKIFVPVEWHSNGYGYGIIAMSEDEKNILDKINKKCGVANSENAEFLSAGAAQSIASGSPTNYLNFLTELDKKIEEKITSSKIQLIKEDGYFLFDEKDPTFWKFKGFCHHSEHEALYYYYLETMKLEDFWF